MVKNNLNKTGISDSIQGLTNLIGNTPLFEIEFTYKGRPGRIFAKAENFNLTGSIKDRMALHIMREAYRRNLIRPGDRVIEATSGNTGIAFSAVGRALGHPVTIFMPDWMSEPANLLKMTNIHSCRASLRTKIMCRLITPQQVRRYGGS